MFTVYPGTSKVNAWHTPSLLHHCYCRYLPEIPRVVVDVVRQRDRNPYALLFQTPAPVDTTTVVDAKCNGGRSSQRRRGALSFDFVVLACTGGILTTFFVRASYSTILPLGLKPYVALTTTTFFFFNQEHVQY